MTHIYIYISGAKYHPFLYLKYRTFPLNNRSEVGRAVWSTPKSGERSGVAQKVHVVLLMLFPGDSSEVRLSLSLIGISDHPPAGLGRGYPHTTHSSSVSSTSFGRAKPCVRTSRRPRRRSPTWERPPDRHVDVSWKRYDGSKFHLEVGKSDSIRQVRRGGRKNPETKQQNTLEFHLCSFIFAYCGPVFWQVIS